MRVDTDGMPDMEEKLKKYSNEGMTSSERSDLEFELEIPINLMEIDEIEEE